MSSDRMLLRSSLFEGPKTWFLRILPAVRHYSGPCRSRRPRRSKARSSRWRWRSRAGSRSSTLHLAFDGLANPGPGRSAFGEVVQHGDALAAE
ncbi:hypothetical protein SSCG_03588 [Streptomyces clavuligerus]|nr:hypothetical protein SSCG_03588 [Streptomyces clavuligerus]